MSETQTQFIRILQDECISKEGPYRIVTSIYNLIYRTEIFLNNTLVDALEEECNYLAYDTKKDEHFKNKYINSHQETKNKYCQKKSTILSQAKKNLLKLKKINFDYKKLSIILLGFLLSITLIFGIKKMMEPSTKDIRKEPTIEILPTPDTPLLKTPIINSEEPIQEIITDNIDTAELVGKKEQQVAYEWVPKEALVLDIKHTLSLTFTNNTDKTVHITLSNRTLNESQYDEIIQFVEGAVEGYVEAYRTKIFEIYIEPTYYRQFEIGTYTGVLTFTLDGEKKKKEFNKHFSFQVE